MLPIVPSVNIVQTFFSAEHSDPRVNNRGKNQTFIELLVWIKKRKNAYKYSL